MIRSEMKGSFVFVLIRSLRVLLFLFLLFLSNCASVNGSDLDNVRFKFSGSSSSQEEEKHSVSELEEVYRISVLGDVDWTDTGLEVKENQEIYFSALGGISLQKGNPKAYCGPDGYPLKTMQQPFSDRNIGALIGKVVLLISIELDEETGEEIRHEIGEIFYIGAENDIRMPLSGRLFLGINENIVADNSGEYEVIIYFPFFLFPLG